MARQQMTTSKRPRAVFVMDHSRSREHALWAVGSIPVAGVDEAGIGPLAGPVVAAAVILPPYIDTRGLDDSKKLSERRRNEQFTRIQAEAAAWAVAECSPAEVDALNIYHAGLLAMRRAILALGVNVAHALVDGRTIGGLDGIGQTRIVGGDAQEPCIAAASIMAKVTRDRIMQQLHVEFPHYGFSQHMGYPTPQHLDALRVHGPCPAHRRSFAPVRLADPAQRLFE